jgi:hypothetical protein
VVTPIPGLEVRDELEAAPNPHLDEDVLTKGGHDPLEAGGFEGLDLGEDLRGDAFGLQPFLVDHRHFEQRPQQQRRS